jgi:ubiquitin C-terminal hydrolase
LGYLIVLVAAISQHFFHVARAEISSVPTTHGEQTGALPNISYDLFGTVNHFGSLESGRYVANVKSNDQWYNCHDSYIFLEQEPMVLNSEGTCILFYQRRTFAVETS